MNKKILGTFSKISSANLINIIVGILKIKFLSVTLGTEGMGVLGQLLNINNFIIFLTTFGIPLGIVKYISEWESQDKYEEIYSLLKKIFLFSLFISVFISISIIIFAPYISILSFGSGKFKILIVFLAISFPFTVLTSLLESYLRGLKRYNEFVKVTIINTIVSSAVFVLFPLYLGVEGLEFSFLVSAIICTLIYLFFLLKWKIISLKRLLSKVTVNVNSPFWDILKLGFASLIIGCLSQISLLVIRRSIIEDFGLSVNGLYQSVLSVSNNYISFIYMALGVYYLPLFSQIADEDKLNLEINSGVKFVVCFVFPIIASSFVFRNLLIRLFFNSQFDLAEQFYFFNFLGDFFRAIALMLALWQIPKLKTKSWILLESFYNLNLVFFYFLIIYLFNAGAKSASAGYLAANIIHCFLNFEYLRRSNHFKFTKKNKFVVSVSIISIVLLFGISSYDYFWGMLLIAPVITIWGLLVVSKDDYLQIVSIVRTRFFNN